LRASSFKTEFQNGTGKLAALWKIGTDEKANSLEQSTLSMPARYYAKHPTK